MAGSLYTLNTIKLQNVNHEMTAAHTMPFSAVETLKEGWPDVRDTLRETLRRVVKPRLFSYKTWMTISTNQQLVINIVTVITKYRNTSQYNGWC